MAANSTTEAYSQDATADPNRLTAHDVIAAPPRVRSEEPQPLREPEDTNGLSDRRGIVRPLLLTFVFAAWLAIPFLLMNRSAMDGSAFVAAGDLAIHGHVEDIYPTDERMPTAFLGAQCGGCSKGTPFVSPPAAVTMVAPLGCSRCAGVC